MTENRNTARLVDSYLEYKRKREEIKNRQREELDEELVPYLRAVAREIQLLRGQGMNVDEFGAYITKDRNFVYQALKTLGETNPAPTKPTKTTVEGYKYKKTKNGFEVTIDSNTYELQQVNGVVLPPDAWAEETDSDLREAYGKIIRGLQNL